MPRARHVPLLLLLTASLAARAQTHKVNPPETVVRAVGVYEWTGDLNKPTASRLIPVSLFINGHFEDAGVYLARPVPFVLDTGFAYELDDAGVARGLFDTQAAANLSGGAAAFDDPWIGTGHFVPPAPPPKVAALRTIKNPTILSSKTLNSGDDSRPRLVNKSPDEQPGAKPADTTSSSAKTGPAPDPSTVGTGAPRPTTTSSTSSSSDDENNVDRPTLRRQEPPSKEQQKAAEAARKKSQQSSVSGPDVPLNDDPDRPMLRHHSSDTTPTGPATLLGLPADMHQLTAVSDAATRPEHNFARPWQDDAEHAAILAQLQSTARELLALYEKANPLPAGADTTSISHAGPVSTPTPTGVVAPDTGAPRIQRGIPTSQSTATTPAPTTSSATTAQSTTTKSTTPSTPTKPTAPAKPLTAAARRRAAAAAAAAAKAAPPPLEPLLDEQLHGYELSYEADATFVYTAHTAGTGAGQRFVTIVAQQDPITNQLQIALQSVTDAAHRDRTPQMLPVDVVDADGTNRASVLMELRSQNTRQFALYRVMSGRADQIFLSGTTE